MPPVRSRSRRWTVLAVVLAAVPVALVLWAQHEPLPSPGEGEALLTADAQAQGWSGVTAACRVVGSGDEEVLGCRLRDAEGRYGWGTVKIGTGRVEGYRGTHRTDVVLRRHEFPVSSEGVAELDATVPGTGPGPTGGSTLGATLAFVLHDSLRAAGYGAPTFPRCPDLPPGGTVHCAVTGIPAAVEVHRPGPGGEHRIRLTVTPR
ncbi:hypothetical protein C8E95_1418 [Pseudonocardia autotrophica]|uniref:Uncharacterized protein n=1 Tax=Pseudonocardia autotrophica TaxID=2074 RepID=A0A1Y2MQA1_PSEAH|nr:hypothetical protein [Pseudonocardia autotrophica]OSY37341.1 hypothetical protein BG845_04852 [Pseudonocardia autotrophica]TDN72362.1 hypothetical protein C8E95_1418 [Pseudonocardia autotrophica]BBG03072.1 hypothetical protein Pdca_42810 [Pseudonocardia autotrophica]